MVKKAMKKVGGLNLACMAKRFLSYKLRKEDDVKLHFYAEIMKPLVQALNPNGVNDYCSENVLRGGDSLVLQYLRIVRRCADGVEARGFGVQSTICKLWTVAMR